MRIGVKRAQSVVEFLIMFGALLLFFVIFMAIINVDVSRENKEKRNVVMDDIASDIRDEISLASKASNGYSREFRVPENMLGLSYDLTIADNYIFLTTDENSVLYRIFNVTGDIQKGNNLIKKENETIYLN